MRVKFIFPLFVLLLAAVLAQGANPPLTKGMTFVAARKTLLHDGWVPQKTARQTEHFAVDKELLKKNIVEVDVCTLDSYCIFQYTRRKECLRVSAHGEALRDLVVTSWEHGCQGR